MSNIYYFILYFGFFFLFSCGQNKADSVIDQQVFRYNEVNNIKSLDPAFAKDLSSIWPVNHLFNCLVRLDDDLNIQPDLAYKWEIDALATTYTFHLRPKVHFHSDPAFGEKRNRTLVAADVVYSLNRVRADKTASPGAWVMQKVADIKALDDLTLEIKLKEAFPAFLSLLTMKYCAVVPHEAVSFYGDDFRKHPIGTGPFYLKIWEENTKLVLRKNPSYFEKDVNGNQLPYLEAIAVTFLPDKQSEFLQFLLGNIDFVSGIDPSYKDELLDKEGRLMDKYNKKVRLLRTSYLNTEYLGFNMNTPIPLALRRAINYGFDRKEMVQYLRNGIGVPAEQGFVPPVLLGQQIEGYSYQPEKAQFLINQYIADGKKLPEIRLATTPQYVDLCEYIQNAMSALSLDIKIDLMTPSTLRQMKAQTKLSFFRASWIADYPDAENFLSLYSSSNKTPNGPNYTHFDNKAYDQLFLKAIKTKEPKERKQLYASLDSLIVKQAPVVPLYYDEVVRFVSPKVKNMGINAINLLQLKEVSKQP